MVANTVAGSSSLPMRLGPGPSAGGDRPPRPTALSGGDADQRSALVDPSAAMVSIALEQLELLALPRHQR